MKVIKKVAIHHTGGLGNNPYAPTQHLAAKNINEAHRVRWNFKSGLGKYGGYNTFINKDGTWEQFRLIGEETIAQRGYNFDTFSSCLAGNFSRSRKGGIIDQPTPAQVATYKQMMIALIKGKEEAKRFGLKFAPNTDIKIKVLNILPHRRYSNTECYGGSLNDDWARQMIIDFYEVKINALERVVDLLIKIINRITRKGRLASAPVSCEESARG